MASRHAQQQTMLQRSHRISALPRMRLLRTWRASMSSSTSTLSASSFRRCTCDAIGHLLHTMRLHKRRSLGTCALSDVLQIRSPKTSLIHQSVEEVRFQSWSGVWLLLHPSCYFCNRSSLVGLRYYLKSNHLLKLELHLARMIVSQASQNRYEMRKCGLVNRVALCRTKAGQVWTASAYHDWCFRSDVAHEIPIANV